MATRRTTMAELGPVSEVLAKLVMEEFKRIDIDPVLSEIADGILLDFLEFRAGLDGATFAAVKEAAALGQQAAHEEAEIIFGVVTDPNLADTVKVTVIALSQPPLQVPGVLVHVSGSEQMSLAVAPPLLFNHAK